MEREAITHSSITRPSTTRVPLGILSSAASASANRFCSLSSSSWKRWSQRQRDSWWCKFLAMAQQGHQYPQALFRCMQTLLCPKAVLTGDARCGSMKTTRRMRSTATTSFCSSNWIKANIACHFTHMVEWRSAGNKLPNYCSYGTNHQWQNFPPYQFWSVFHTSFHCQTDNLELVFVLLFLWVLWFLHKLDNCRPPSIR